jgi:hypothetical protein
MRHLRSILYALVLAPAVWVLCAVGFTGDLTGRARDGGGIETLTGLLLLLLAGAAYAILLLAPISPAGPAIAGAAFLGVAVWALAAPSAYAGLWPPNVAKDGFDLRLPGYGLAVALAVPLLCTALSTRRWARYEPPVLPLIGTLGRGRGAAPIAGEPDDDATRVLAAPSRSTRPSTTPAPGSRPASDPGPASGSGPASALGEDEATTLLPSAAAVQRGGAAPESGTRPLAQAAAKADEPTGAVVEQAAAASAAGAVAAASATQDGGAEGGSWLEDDRTQVLRPPLTEGAAAVAHLDAGPAVAGSLPDHDAAASDEGTPSGEGTQPGEGVQSGQGAQPGEGVQSGQGTQPGEGAPSDRDVARPGRTPNVGPGEKTHVIARNPGETTQVIRQPGGIYPVPGETTRAITAGGSTVEPPGDRTQVIRLPTGNPPGERRPVRPEPAPPSSIVGSERPDPGADPTTRIVPPPRAGTGETSTRNNNTTPGPANETARRGAGFPATGAPGPAYDEVTTVFVTGRGAPAGTPAAPVADGGASDGDTAAEATTEAVTPRRRPLTVMHLERPPDEIADDTTVLPDPRRRDDS